MNKIQEFNFELKEDLETEATEGFCNKWVINRRDKDGRHYKFWIKIGANDWSGFYDHQSLGEFMYYQVAKDLGLEKFVLPYHLCIVNLKDSTGKVIPTLGCYSLSMNRENEELISLDKLDRERVYKSNEDGAIEYKDLIVSLSKRTEIPVGNIRAWLDVCILLDSICLNTDRRMANLAVIRNKDTGKFRLAPIFDSGQSFLLKDNLCTVYSWDDYIIQNESIYTKLLIRDSNRFHDYDLPFTHFYSTDKGREKLKVMSNKSFTNTKNSLDIVFKIFGSSLDSQWDSDMQQKVKTIRKAVYPAIEINERNFIMDMILGRAETVINQRRPEFVPKSPSDYDKNTYETYYRYFK